MRSKNGEKLQQWQHFWFWLAIDGWLCVGSRAERGHDVTGHAFAHPPDAAKPWCYWWWLNGAASKEGITRDFEEMKKQGIGGALLFDAGEAGPEAPRGPHFMSAAWRRAVQARRARGGPAAASC